MKVLDLFCGEGGAGYGYHLAGADMVIGVDLHPQKRYPFGFLQADCLKLDVRFLRQFDLIHASPPCQFGTELNSNKAKHLNLIPQTRALLKASGVPYVIENVRGVRDHLIEPVSLFGTMFGNGMTTSTGQQYVLSRERLFETNWELTPPWDPGAGRGPIANIYGGHLRCRDKAHRTGNGTGRTRDFIGEDKPALARTLMEMPWATMVGMSEAVPPSYTQFIGEQFLAQQGKAA